MLLTDGENKELVIVSVRPHYRRLAYVFTCFFTCAINTGEREGFIIRPYRRPGGVCQGEAVVCDESCQKEKLASQIYNDPRTCVEYIKSHRHFVYIYTLYYNTTAFF